MREAPVSYALNPCHGKAMARPRHATPKDVPGFTARRIAADILDGVLRRRLPLDDQLDGAGAHPDLASLEERDRALVRALVAMALRRLGTLRALIARLAQKGLPADAPRVEAALLIGATQILWMEVPNHAAVDLSVRLAQADRRALHYSGLVNAVLRRLTREGPALLVEVDSAETDLPAWLRERWQRHYGAETTRAIAQALAHEPALDVSVKGDPAAWAEQLAPGPETTAAESGKDQVPNNRPERDGASRTSHPVPTMRVMPTGTVRLIASGSVTQLPGFAEGAFWVQDAAAALPARLLLNALGDPRGKMVADLCAAPGGKTAQLVLAGATVTAVDRSQPRLARLTSNLERLGLAAETIAADVTAWQGGPFDGVLLDAPCSSTGTIRRHPDVPWLKSETDIATLSALQRRLIDRAVELLTPDGVLVYCTCSLEPEEGIAIVTGLLDRDHRVRRRPITPDEVGGHAELITADGDLRTLPSHWPDPDPRMAGLDGFFAARLTRH
jgi:16S rRNA (cytosine967-C5)-methyltransferase